MEKLFRHFDKDGSGQLDFAEFHKCVRVGAGLLVHDMSESELAHFFEMVDDDDSGTLSITELIVWLYPGSTQPSLSTNSEAPSGLPPAAAGSEPSVPSPGVDPELEPSGPPPPAESDTEPSGPPP